MIPSSQAKQQQDPCSPSVSTVISTTSGTESTDTLARSSLTGIAEGAAAVGTILILTIIAAVIAGYFIVRRRRSHRVPGVIDLQDKQVYGIENIMLPGIANR